jgi:hypothetical protein
MDEPHPDPFNSPAENYPVDTAFLPVDGSERQ